MGKTGREILRLRILQDVIIFICYKNEYDLKRTSERRGNCNENNTSDLAMCYIKSPIQLMVCWIIVLIYLSHGTTALEGHRLTTKEGLFI